MPNHKIIKNICIVRLSAIGDVCHALAIVRSIQAQYPNTKITWIIGKVESTLVGDIEDIEFIVFDKKAGLIEYKNIYRKLTKRSFDVALFLHASLRANIVSLMVKSPLRIGYDFTRARELQWLITNKKIKKSSGKHVLDTMFEFLDFIGIKKKNLDWDIPLKEKEMSYAKDYCIPNKNNVVISPCSSHRYQNYRNWSTQNYSEAIDYLIEKLDCRVILTGSNSSYDKEVGQRICELNSNKIINLIGTTSLKELAAIIKLSDLVISPDSGPIHISTAVNTKVIGLYATSNPHRTGPYNDLNLTVNNYPKACQKYLGKKEDELKWGKRIRNSDAMNLIKTEDLFLKIDKFFDLYRK